ncbi:MAG: membrane protein [Cyclobacteriaceae bacterium]|nr:MAG: membrane protein [Cyclobacteriaceae bacterium]
MPRISKIAVVAVLCILSNIQINAQNTYSPYSVFGVGDLVDMDLVQNTAMGGLGISNGTPFHLNNKNPALLTHNRVVVFETAISTEQKKLSNSDLSQDSFTGGLGYLAFGFPVIRDTWTISVGMMPYSIVNYESNDLGFVSGENTPLTTSYRGEGGVSRAYFATGLKLTEGLSIGLRASYLFGSIKKETQFFVFNTSYLTADISEDAFSDIKFGLGAAYSLHLKDQTYLNFGVTYDIGGDQNLTRSERLERRDLSGDRLSPDDPPYLIADDTPGADYFPSTLGVGISFEKKLKWMIGADLSTGKWSEYRDFDGESEGLGNLTEVAVGGSFIPDAFSVSNYLNRITYMMGINYQKTPYLVNDQEINDFGINFGVTLPLRNLSRLSLAFQVGQRGSKDNDLIQERYFKAHLGITVNDNKWFIRRKFD